MANELTDIELDEVSCVKAGANPGARIVLAKTNSEVPARYKIGKAGVRYDSEMSLTDRIEDIGMAVQAKFGRTEMGDYCYVCIEQVFEDAVIIRTGDDLFRVTYTHDASSDKVELGEPVPVKVVYEDSGAEATEKALKGASNKMPDVQDQAAFTKALADMRAEMVADFEKRQADAAADFEKRLGEERAERGKAEALAKAEREERRLNEFVAKGKAEYPHVPLSEKRKGEVLKAVTDSLPQDVAADVEKVFASANASAAELTKATGTVARVPAGGSAEAQLDKLAKDLATEKNITFAKAYAQVLDHHKDLYEQYKAERRNN